MLRHRLIYFKIIQHPKYGKQTVEPVFGTIKETLGFFLKNEISEKFYFNKA